MYKNLEKQLLDVAENFIKLINDKITEVELKKEKNNSEIEMGGELHEIISSIRILNHMVMVVGKMNRISQENDQYDSLDYDN